MKKKKTLIIVTGITLILLATIGLTYAWFTGTVSGNNNASSVIVKSGTLSLNYTNGNEIKGENILPGWSEEKTFTIKNTGTVNVYYKIAWDNLTNTFVNTNDLIYTLTGTTTGSNTPKNLTQTSVPNSVDSKTALDGILISPNETHTYTMKITYNNRNADQSSDLGKVLNGKIKIEESVRTITLEGQAMYNGVPVSNGSVEIHSEVKRAITDVNGNYKIEDVPLGNHTVYVKDSSNNTLGSSQIKISEGQTTTSNGTEATLDKETTKYGLNLTISNSILTPIFKSTAIPLKDAILTDNSSNGKTIQNVTSDTMFSTISTSSQTGLWKENRTGKTENNKPVYFYRGATQNNYVSFAGKMWRIVRINENGTIKLILGGGSTTDGYGGTTKYNSSYNQSQYVDYATSELKTNTELWYNQNVIAENDSKVASTIYCNDKSVFSASNGTIIYGAYNRLNTKKSPQYKCTNSSDNITLKVASLTADEIVYTGGTFNLNNSEYYLYDNAQGVAGSRGSWWTMTPYNFRKSIVGSSTYYYAETFYIYGAIDKPGHLGYYTTPGFDFSFRPVISLSSDTLTTGTGIQTNPYVIE